MGYNSRNIEITSVEQAQAEMKLIQCDPAGTSLMSNKAVFKAIKLEKIPTKAANLLKQTFLAKGGEAAITRGSADLSASHSDVLILATCKQYNLALNQLKAQPWGLPAIAEEIETVLKYNMGFPQRHYHWKDRELKIQKGRTLVMGILNITPDSFSDGGKFQQLDAALRHAEEMQRDGADILDIGAESTRPYGSQKVSADEEAERLLPVLERLLQETPLPVSVDTYKASVAREALRLGAHIINDVWGLQYDPQMAAIAAEYNVPIIIMHNQENSVYASGILSEICRFLRRSADIASQAGILRENIIIDPGIGFGKTPVQNLEVMQGMEQLTSLGYPILLGTSRKKFIGEVLNAEAGDRVEGTGATVSIGIAKGANIVRVHDVKAMARVAKMTDAILGGRNNER